MARPEVQIVERFATRGGVPFVVREAFPDPTPAVIAVALDEFCERHLGAGIDEGEFFEASVGSVHGLRLRDGRRIVLKLHTPNQRRRGPPGGG